MNLCPDLSKDPLPWIFLCLIAQELATNFGAVGKQAADCAVLQFDAYLRPHVATELCDFNVMEPPSNTSRQYQQWGLLLSPSDRVGTTKTGARDDSVLLGCNPARAFVQQVRARLLRDCRRRGGGALFPLLNLNSYEHVISQASAKVGFTKLRVTPHLFRHGGASTDRFENSLSLEEIMKRGQWKALSSVMRYEKHARLLKVLNSVTPALRAAATTAAKGLATLMT